MEYYTFKYDKNSTKANLYQDLSKGKYKVHSVAYPMIIKSVANAFDSPTGESTNMIRMKKHADANYIDIVYGEGFPSSQELQQMINQAIIKAFPNEDKLPLLELASVHELRWINDSPIAWDINYVNLGTKQLITGNGYTNQNGVPNGSINLTEPLIQNSYSNSFIPDPRFGASFIKLNIGSNNFTLPAAGKLYDSILFYYLNLPVLNINDFKIARLTVNFESLSTEKELRSRNTANIQLSVCRY